VAVFAHVSLCGRLLLIETELPDDACESGSRITFDRDSRVGFELVEAVRHDDAVTLDAPAGGVSAVVSLGGLDEQPVLRLADVIANVIEDAREPCARS